MQIHFMLFFPPLPQFPLQFAMADINIILNKLKMKGEPQSREIKQIFAAADPQHTTIIDYDEFR